LVWSAPPLLYSLKTQFHAVSFSPSRRATEQGEHQHNKAIELLKEMKQDLGERTTMAFDGAISTLKKEGDW
jgi:hypothetical protein